jgi:hypothetical protein
MLACKQQRLEAERSKIMLNLMRANARQRIERQERLQAPTAAERWAARAEVAWQRQVKQQLHYQLLQVVRSLTHEQSNSVPK